MEEGCQTLYRPVPGPLSSWKAVLLFKQKERAIADAMRPPLLFLYLCVWLRAREGPESIYCPGTFRAIMLCMVFLSSLDVISGPN
jgi:hypothetical protein